MLATLRTRGLLWPTLMTLAALPLLVGLGLWQLDRLAWKEGLVASLATRTAAPPVGLDEAVARWLRPEDVEYLRVTAYGRFEHDKERYLYAPSPTEGPGYEVLTPLVVPGGRVLFVDRGFVPDPKRDPATRPEGAVAGDVEVTGLLRKPGAPGAFAPDNRPDLNLWYWRDVEALYRSAYPRGGPPLIPLVLDAEAAAPGGWPKGAVTRLELPNRHFEYALTWFGLAAALLGVFIAYAVPRLKPAP